MKKILSYIIVLLAFVSCGEDISVNDTAVFQGVKDNATWIGGNAVATIEVGNKISIKAVTLSESMSLRIPKPTTFVNPKKESSFITHVLGTTTIKKATYILTTGSDVFTYETAIGVGDGEIVIKEYDGNVISGTFRFNAENIDPESTAQEVVNMQNGVFYKVPVQ
ncbi:MAG: hypothetical protein IPN80_02910 [Flavobacterium sp.]|nr:hypothetical protein [Flavobacterium sp.]